MLPRVNVYLDIDGVLLSTDRERPSRLALADHAVEFLGFVVANFDVYWLTPACRGDAIAAMDHLVRHARLSDREHLMGLCARIRATNYKTLRTEALPAGEPFIWIDDAPSDAELADLRARGLFQSWLWIDTREEPEDLLRAKKILAGKAQSA